MSEIRALERHFPHVNTVTVSGEILSAPRMRTSQSGSVSMTFVMKIEDMREQRTGRARLTVVVFDDLAQAAQGALGRGSEVLIEGSLAPAGLKATGARLRAVRIQTRDSEGRTVLVAHSPAMGAVSSDAPAAAVTHSPEVTLPAPKVAQSEAAQVSAPPTAKKTRSAGGSSTATRKRSVRKTSQTAERASRPKSPKAPRSETPKSADTKGMKSEEKRREQKRERVKSSPKKKTDESPFAFDESEDSFDPFLIGNDDK